MKKLIEKSDLPFKVVGEAYNGVTALEEMETVSYTHLENGDHDPSTGYQRGRRRIFSNR